MKHVYTSEKEEREKRVSKFLYKKLFLCLPSDLSVTSGTKG